MPANITNINDLATVNGTRMDISYISNYGQLMKEDNLDNITASIRYTNQVENVMKLTESPIKYKDLSNIISANNPNIELNKIEEFLKQLIDNEYLITELRPPLANTGPFKYILSRLENIKPANSIYRLLEEIKLLIDKYNELPIGSGIKSYLEIIQKMELLYKCENYLQVDMSTATEKVDLDNDIALEIEKLTELLFKLSYSGVRYDYLEEYLNDFMEVYGENREVQVLELLDEDKGLGSPAGYTKPISHKQMKYKSISVEEKRIQSFLSNKVLRAIRDNKKEVVITDEEVEKIQIKHIMNTCLTP